MASQPMIVFVTAPSRDVGRQIAAALVEQRLAACVNILGPMNSIYTWNEKICDEEEILLIVKTQSDLIEGQLIPAILAIHPYQVPEIIAFPIAIGLPGYLEWVMQATGGGPT
jgi:periplasmic divalent cation tolerance protein